MKPTITMFTSHVLALRPKRLMENPMFRLLKPLPLALAIAGLCIMTTSCGLFGSKSTQVRVFNALDSTYGTNGVNVEFNGAQTFSAPITFGSVLPEQPAAGPAAYTSVSSGTDTIAVYSAGTTTNPIVESSLSLDGGTQYTAILEPDIITLVTDDNTAPASGSNLVEFRVIDASSATTNSVDVYLVPCGEPLSSTYKIGTIQNRGVIPYVSKSYNSDTCAGSSANYEFEVFLEGSTSNPYVNQYYTEPAGSITTLVLYDNSSGSSMSSVPIMLQDLD